MTLETDMDQDALLFLTGVHGDRDLAIADYDNFVAVTGETHRIEAVKAANKVHLDYLASTDWYTTRSVDEGIPVPTDIATKRAEARAAITGVS